MTRRPLCIALALLALSLAGCVVVRPKPPVPSLQPTAVMYVVRRAWHIDIGFSTGDLDPPLRSLGSAFAGAHFLLFGKALVLALQVASVTEPKQQEVRAGEG